MNLERRNKADRRWWSWCYSYTVRANDSWKFWWDTIILIMAIFNSITIPLTLSFDEISSDLTNNKVYYVVNIIATLLFISDIFIQMNTTYYDSDGEEIFDKKKIIKNYVFGIFTIDLLSSPPIEFIAPVSLPTPNLPRGIPVAPAEHSEDHQGVQTDWHYQQDECG